MQEEKRKPTMLNAEQVAERLNMSKGYAYKIIRQMNEEQEAFGRPVVRGRVRWIGNTYLDSFSRNSPAFLNSTGLM